MTKLILKMGCYDLRKILRATPMHRRGSWRDGRIWNEGTPCKLPPDFANFQNFKHQIACIAMQYKAYQPHDSDFTTFRKCIFNVHQITTSGGKFNIFLARTRTKIPLRIHQNMPFQVNNSFFSGQEVGTFPDPFSMGRGPLLTPLGSTKPPGSAPASPTFQADYATAPMRRTHLPGTKSAYPMVRMVMKQQ